MKRLLVAAVAAIAITPAASAEDKPGRIIGDGKVLPREYVFGKSGVQRSNEIARWMLDHGGTQTRNCYPNQADKFCMDGVTLPLADGAWLLFSTFTNLNGAPSYSTYCRTNPEHDISFCYRFDTNSYFSNVKDTATGNWVVVWDQLTAEKEQKQPPAQQAEKQPDIEL
jgi:hypothetical protein